MIFRPPSSMTQKNKNKKKSKKECKKQRSEMTTAKLCLFSHDRMAALLNSKCLWLPTQDLHRIQLVRKPAYTGEGLMKAFL